MTPTSDDSTSRHDTLLGVSSRGTDRKSIRLDDEHWAKLGKAASATGKDRTAVIKELIRWFNREPGAELPERPAAEGE